MFSQILQHILHFSRQPIGPRGQGRHPGLIPRARYARWQPLAIRGSGGEIDDDRGQRGVACAAPVLSPIPPGCLTWLFSKLVCSLIRLSQFELKLDPVPGCTPGVACTQVMVDELRFIAFVRLRPFSLKQVAMSV